MGQGLNILFFTNQVKETIFHCSAKNMHCNSQIQQSEAIKFLGVFLDENLAWTEHIKYIENKMAKKYLHHI